MVSMRVERDQPRSDRRWFRRLLSKLVGSDPDEDLSPYGDRLAAIAALEDDLEPLSDDALKRAALELRELVTSGGSLNTPIRFVSAPNFRAFSRMGLVIVSQVGHDLLNDALRQQHGSQTVDIVPVGGGGDQAKCGTGYRGRQVVAHRLILGTLLGDHQEYRVRGERVRLEVDLFQAGA